MCIHWFFCIFSHKRFFRSENCWNIFISILLHTSWCLSFFLRLSSRRLNRLLDWVYFRFKIYFLCQFFWVALLLSIWNLLFMDLWENESFGWSYTQFLLEFLLEIREKKAWIYLCFSLSSSHPSQIRYKIDFRFSKKVTSCLFSWLWHAKKVKGKFLRRSWLCHGRRCWASEFMSCRWLGVRRWENQMEKSIEEEMLLQNFINFSGQTVPTKSHS